MQKSLILISLLSVMISACSNLEFPGVYKITVEQGNIVTQEMIDQLKPGMTRSQVEYVLGSALIRDSFNNDRWDYVYTLKKGAQATEQKRLTVFFEADKLKTFTGDFIPTPADSNTTSDAEEPSPQEQQELL
jgi:outer membrane protein assembly factor BamE